MKHSPEDQEILDASNMFRRAAYGEERPKAYPFVGVQIWLSGFVLGGFIVWLFMQ